MPHRLVTIVRLCRDRGMGHTCAENRETEEETVTQAAPEGTILVTLAERDAAEELAEQLREQGYAPCTVHRDMYAGEDDAEDVDWVVEVRTGPDGASAIMDEEGLSALAEEYGGFVNVEE